MTIQPTGTPDWTTILPGGAKPLVLQQNFTVPGTWQSAAVDVTKYNGLALYVSLGGVSTQLVVVSVEFANTPTGSVVLDTYTAVMQGSQLGRVNVPVLGPYAQVFVQVVGGGNIVANTVQLVGHNGGPAASARTPRGQLAGIWAQPIAAGATIAMTGYIVTEGPAHLVLASTGAKGQVSVSTVDTNGSQQLVAQMVVAANSSDMRQFWVPPGPLTVQFTNSDAVSASFWGGVWIGRP